MDSEYKIAIKKYRRTLGKVFDSLWFDDYNVKTVIRDSYFINLNQIIDYARENGIDETAHLMQIQQILLKSKHVHPKRVY